MAQDAILQQPASDNPYEGIVSTLYGGDEARLRVAGQAADPIAPADATEAAQLAQRTGLPPDLVLRNLPAIRQRAQAVDTPYAQMLRDTPQTAAFASDPVQHAAAKDDLQALGFLEWLKTYPRLAWDRGQASVRLAQLRAKEVLGQPLTADDHQQIATLQQQLASGGRLSAGGQWFRGAIAGAAQNLPFLWGSTLQGAKYGAAGAAEVGAAGAAVGALGAGAAAIPGALAGAGAGAEAGFLYGNAKFGFETAAGQAYDEFSQVKDALGRPLDPQVARVAALAVGAVNGALMTIGARKLFESIPGVDRLVGQGATDAVAAALRNPATQSALLGAIKEYGGTVTLETAMMIAQRGAQILGGEIAKTASNVKAGTTIEHTGPQEIAQDLAHTGVDALSSFALLSLPGAAGGYFRLRAEAADAQHNTDFFAALGAGVKQSKVAQRAPDVAQAFLANVAKDGPVPTVYAPIEDWTTYWQSKGVDPAQMAAEVTGNRDAYAQALQTGADLPIPTANYAVKLAPTDHNAHFAQQLRLAPEQMNAVEAQRFEQDLQTQLAQPAPPAEPSPVRDQVQAQLEAAGLQPHVAESYASVYDAAFRTLGERAGIAPDQLFSRYGLTISREGIGATETGPQPENDRVQHPGIEPQPDEGGAIAHARAERGDRAETGGQEPQGEITPSDVYGRPEVRAAINALAERREAEVRGGALAEPKQQTLFQRVPPLANEAFRAWFGRSVARDTAGEPIVFYHGTATDFDAFDVNKAGSTAGSPDERALFFSVHPDTATHYAESAGVARADREGRIPAGTAVEDFEPVGSRILPVYLKLDDPAISPREGYNSEDMAREIEDARAAGHDGIIFPKMNGAGEAGTVAVFSPEQVKSALGNRGTFERGNPNILHQSGPPIARLTGEELGESTADVATLRTTALRYYRERLQGETVERPGFGVVQFTKKGRDHLEAFSGNPDKLRLIPAIPSIIRGGRYGGRVESYKPRRDNLVAFHNFTGTVALGDRLIDARVIVGEDALGNKFYDLHVPKTKAPVSRGDKATGPEPPEGGPRTTLTQSIADEPDGLNLTLSQIGGPEARGRISFGGDRQFNIDLLQRADLSTFLHETGHFYLEVLGDLADEVRGNEERDRTSQQQQLLDDYEATLRFLGADTREGVGTAQHETFARAFEAYLMEGKAPSAELRRPFARFRAWLTGVYRSITRLNVQLTPDVRGVFDRLLASDDAIQQAEQEGDVRPLFTSAESAGMSEADFATYRATVADASERAREALQARVLRDLQRERQTWWKDARDATRQQVATDFNEDPTYRAVAAIQKGTRPDGTPLESGEPLKISKASLGRYDADTLKALRRFDAYRVEGGVDVDTAASLLGFSSGDELVQTLKRAQPLNQALDAEADRRMRAEHGDLLLDGTLDEKAAEFVNGEGREKVVRAELRALAKKQRDVAPFVSLARKEGESALAHAERERAYERRWLEAEAGLRIAIAEGHKQVEIDALRSEVEALRSKARGGAATIRAALPPQRAIDAHAQDSVGRARVRNLRPSYYLAAARRLSRDAMESAARQDFSGAIDAKHKELINLALYREATKAADFAEEARSYLGSYFNRTRTRERIGKAGGDYLDQIDGLRAQYEFARVSNKELDRRASLAKWLEGQEADGHAFDIPQDVIDRARAVNYRDLTVDELRGVHDAVKQIEHWARFKNRLLRAADQRDLSALASEGAETVAAHGSTVPPATEPRLPAGAVRRNVSGFLLAHRPLQAILRQLDGYADGFFFRNVWTPAHEARNAEIAMSTAAAQRWTEIHDARFAGEESSLYEPQYIPAIGTSLTTAARLVVALNYGNEGNRERMRAAGVGNTGPLTDAQQRGILDTLTPRDWQYVTDTADLVNSFRPQIAALYKKVLGVEPQWVAPTSFTTAQGGEMPGWYYPISYESRAAAKELVAPDAGFASIIQHSAHSRFTTENGHTQERVAHTGVPLRADLGVVGEHLQNVVHDLTHREMLIDVGRLLKQPDIQAAIKRSYGDQTYREIQGAFRDVAVGPLPAPEWYRPVESLRSGVTLARLAWSFPTIVSHVTNLASGMVRVGSADVIRAIPQWLGSAKDAESSAGWINEQSVFMASRWQHRIEGLDTAKTDIGLNRGPWASTIRDGLTSMGIDPDLGRHVADSYLYGIHKVIQMAEIPTWLAAYRQAVDAGRAHGDAVTSADSAVLDAFGGGDLLDQARVQRNYAGKLFTTFMTYGLSLHRLNYEIFHRDTTIGRKVVDATLLNIVPPALLAGIFSTVQGRGYGQELADELWQHLTSMYVFVRELSGALEHQDYAGPAALAPIGQLTRVVASAAQSVETAKPETRLHAIERAGKTAAEVAGQFYGVPVYQIERTAKGIEALLSGQSHDLSALFFGPKKKAS